MADQKDKASEAEPKATPAGAAALEPSRIDTMAGEVANLLLRRRHKVGELLAGKYRIVRELGDGGMGQVFGAENLVIGRQVALKVLKPELLADEAFRKRFQKEAEAIAAIEHPNVVGFLDLVVGDPTFLVMEYVAGPTLANVLREEQRLPMLRAAELARRLCWGLDAAHSAGVVHRDVKPTNIILAPDAEFGEQPKLIDFGVAKTSSRPADLQLTRHGQIVGTPHYMSPEQITGAEVDSRADVYALGCVLYHMVAGRPPFIGLEEYQILQQHMERAAPPLNELLPDVPPELDRVLRRALAKDPSSRFESMQDMARALAEITRPEDARRRASQPPSRRPRSGVRLRVLSAVALSALALGATGAWLTIARTHSVSSGLLIASEPAGAIVELDGRVQKETTPMALSGLKPGEHLVKLRREGHGDLERRVQVRASGRELLQVTLPATNHRVSINSAPSGATVYLDGTMVLGTTPTFMAVADDDFHEVRLERAGYDTLSYPLKPEDRQPELNLMLEAEKEARGSVTVDSREAAQVFIDGAFSGYETPTLAMRVATGEHTVELRSANARSVPTKILVKKGEALHLTLSFPQEAKP